MFSTIKRRCFYISAGLLLILATVWLLLGWLDSGFDLNRSEGYNNTGVQTNISSRDGSQFPQNQHLETNIIIHQAYYKKCGHTLIKEIVPSLYMKRELQKQSIQQYSGWVLDKYLPGKIVFKKTIDAYCPNHFIVGQENGYVAVFKMEAEGEDMQLLERTNIEVDKLDQGSKLMLSDGVAMDTAEEVELYIENLGS